MLMKKKNKSALKVQKGIKQPPSVDRESVNKFKKRKRISYSHAELSDGILNGDITILAKAISIVESHLPEHQDIACQVINACMPYTGKSRRIGITGVPGAGKSSFIDVFGKKITGMGYKLAVLAIDPSSNISRGSILGDKTRMENLSADPSAFIRPSPASGTLGGVASKTRETMLLCEAAGFDVIFIETVGVGQSETMVRSMVDFFLLLMLAGAGDELQGIKRGIMELADTIAITKADGDNISSAEKAKGDYSNALHLLPPAKSGWKPDVITCSSFGNKGLNELWKIISDYFSFTQNNNFFVEQRKSQYLEWLHSTINEKLHSEFYQSKNMSAKIQKAEKGVLSGLLSPYAAASGLLNEYLNPEVRNRSEINDPPEAEG